MKKFYYLCLLLGMMFGSLTFTACGDDDDNNNNSNEQQQQQDDKKTTDAQNDSSSVKPVADATIVGIWKAHIPSIDDSHWGRYQHQLFWAFDKEGNVQMLTAYYAPDTDNKQVESGIAGATSIEGAIKSINWGYDVEFLYFKGKYQLKDSTFTFDVYEESSFQKDGGWYRNTYSKSKPAYSMEFAYTLSADTLSIRVLGDEWQAHPNYHHTIAGELIRQKVQIVFPSLPEPAPILGTWVMEDDSIHNNKFIFYLNDYCSNSRTIAASGYSPYTGRFYSIVVESNNGHYTLADSVLFVTYTSNSKEYYDSGRRVDSDTYTIPEEQRQQQQFPVVLSGNTMTLWGVNWNREEE